MLGNSTVVKGTQKMNRPSLGTNFAHSLGEVLLPVTGWFGMHLHLPPSALILGEMWQYPHSINLPFPVCHVNLYQSGYVRNNHHKSIVWLALGHFLRQLNLEKHTEERRKKKDLVTDVQISQSASW